MTVLHLLGSPGDGGAETYFLHLVEALRDDGVAQAAAIHANVGRQAALEALGVPAHVYPFAAPFDLVTGPRIRKLAKALPARVMLQWMNRAGRVSPGRGPWGKIGRLGGYYKLRNYAGFDMLVANTRDIAAWIVGQGWPHEKVRYITVIQGTWWVSGALTKDMSTLYPLPAGSVVRDEVNTVHWDGAQGAPVILQISGNGPARSISVDATGKSLPPRQRAGAEAPRE